MDFNAYCLGHITGKERSNDIISYPGNFITEAAAFGAQTNFTKNGFPVIGYVWTKPDMLNTIPRLDETRPVKAVLDAVEKTPPDKTALLKVNCPFSILASLIDPSLFYRWLGKNKIEIHNALYTITKGLAAYTVTALKKGAKILSLADPCANIKILGKERYAEFVARYLVSLFNQVTRREENTGGIIHLCPHSSVALEELGLVTTNSVHSNCTYRNYIDVINQYVKTSRLKEVAIAGHQCIYAENTGTIVFLNTNAVHSSKKSQRSKT
jgi:uroporphyrinogen-III decarboxylase